MKAVMMILLFSLSTAAMAMTEVECTGRSQGTQVRIDIEGRFGQGYFRDATVRVTKDGVTTTNRHALSYRKPWGGQTRVEYTSAMVRVEIDLWPDSVPRWGRTYMGHAYIAAANNRQRISLDCRYPFAQ